MEFCKKCGGALNLFDNNRSGLCSTCILLKEQSGAAKKQEPTAEHDDLPQDAVLTCENNKIILRSKEGWLLWSAPAESQTDLKTVFKAAKFIYGIRKKRKKKS